MSETGFGRFNQVFSITAELLYAGLFTVFFRSFLPQEHRQKKLLLLFSIYILFELVCNQTALPQGSFGLCCWQPPNGLAWKNGPCFF